MKWSSRVSCYVGIDLGTTNSAIAYIDPANAGDQAFPPVQIQLVTQPVAEGRVEAIRTLPSFLYLSDPAVAGLWAREQGALTPTKLVHSAKSWLSNPQVDRTAKILPWDAAEGGRVYSPVDASARYIEDLRKAWEQAHGEAIGGQDVVLTVPASFDEEARELTVEAAKRAGIEKLTLIEEPAAAFYAWIANHLEASRAQLRDGMVVLVCDVGGGTSDFTLIRIERAGDRIDFTRTAVGQHLLLGGDNLDLTLSWLAEQKLNTQLSVRQRSALRRQCSAAKEKLLTEGGPDKVEITVLGAGRSLIGGSLRTHITRDEALELALDGFVPECGRDERPSQEEMSAFAETGLPYVSDPAVTRHLAAFLAASGHVAPDAILFNGGFFIPPVLGRAMTVVPRGTENGQTLELDEARLELVANKPVSFRLYSSLTRLDDAQGEMVEVAEDFHQHAPLNAVIRFGKPGEQRQVPVKLVAKLTEVGTLELYADSKISDNRWRLQFELRKQAEASGAAAQPATVISDEALAAALELVRESFDRGGVTPEELPARLEQALSLGRASWPLTAIRKLADLFLELAESRRQGAAYEARWLNLAGLCLRPGFGFPGDEYRIEQARRLFAQGLVFGNQVQNECEWWIFWGRVSGGLNRNQQSDMFQRLSATLTPRKNQKVRVNSSLLREMWRAAASLELLPVGTKTELGDALLRRVAEGDFKESELWCLSRIGARQLFYGPINAVVPAATAQRWIDALRGVKGAESALAAMARRTGDATRDVPAVTVESLKRAFAGHAKEASLVATVEGKAAGDREFLSRVFGEELPSGLTLARDE
ncbi:MAG: Hsp70 family protein [Bryobacterales bacterium]|nr:Hsp70 family protein [Bryobacterales bacterium]